MSGSYRRAEETAPSRGARLAVPAEGAREASDLELAKALVAGERWAGPMLWNRYSQLVFRIVHRSLQSRDESLDLTQEIFCQILRSIGRLRDPSSLRAWIVSVALRTLKWELRRRRMAFKLSSSGDAPELLVDSGSAETRHAVGRFLSIVRSLPPRVQTAFVLRYVEGLELTEISAATGVSLATVKRDLSHASDEVSTLVADDSQLQSALGRKGRSHETR